MSLEHVTLNLPSRYIPYNIPQGSIRVRPFKGKDEQLIVQMAGINPKKKILELLKNVVDGIEPEKLTMGDVSYILLWEAINSYTHLYPITNICEECDMDINVKVDLGQIDSKELSQDYHNDYTITIGEQTFKLKLLTLADEIELMSWAQKNEESMYLYMWALSIDSDTPVYARMKMLEDFSAKDLSAIRAFHTKFEHGPDFMAPYTCPKCGYEGRVVVPFRLDELIQFAAEA